MEERRSDGVADPELSAEFPLNLSKKLGVSVLKDPVGVGPRDLRKEYKRNGGEPKNIFLPVVPEAVSQHLPQVRLGLDTIVCEVWDRYWCLYDLFSNYNSLISY